MGLAILAAVASGPAPAQPGAAKSAPASIPADVNAQRVPLTTADGVELDGTYFPSPAAGRNAPCLMMVHKYGSDRSKIDWINLAVKLQREGFAVLTFDLRGHGNSTTLSNPQQFWRIPFNRNGIRGGLSSNLKSVIDYKDFKPSYFPYLVNDLAAARRFFELKNDAGEVNVHSLTILGAQEGAGLGFLFTATEYNRSYRVGVTALQSNGTSYIAGEDIAAGVWLSLTMRPGTPVRGRPELQLQHDELGQEPPAHAGQDTNVLYLRRAGPGFEERLRIGLPGDGGHRHPAGAQAHRGQADPRH